MYLRPLQITALGVSFFSRAELGDAEIESARDSLTIRWTRRLMMGEEECATVAIIPRNEAELITIFAFCFPFRSAEEEIDEALRMSFAGDFLPTLPVRKVIASIERSPSREEKSRRAGAALRGCATANCSSCSKMSGQMS